jgi:serine/threonine protein kinase
MVEMHATKNLTPPLRIHDPGHVEYDFLRCLGRNPLGEVWKVKGPDGKPRQAQLLPHGENQAALQRLEFLNNHQGLLPLELVQRSNGQNILVVDYSPRTLRDRFDECWRKGMPGIPRPELLAAVKTVAQTLEALHLQYRVQHLALQPKFIILNRTLDGTQAFLDGFGLVELLWLPTQQPLTTLNPRYSAPELHDEHISDQSDQYSLALIYTEMATGVHPVRGLPTGGPEGRLNLSLLASGEKEVIARALSVNPEERYGGVVEFVVALEAAGARAAAQKQIVEPLGPIISFPSSGTSGQGSLDQFVAELVALAAGPGQVKEFNKIRFTLESGRQLEHRCLIRDFPGSAHLKLDGFRQRWAARPVRQDDNLLIFSVRTPPSFWQRLAGRNVGLEIEVKLTGQPGERCSEINVVIRPFGCGRQQAVRLLEDMGPVVLESVRTHLLAYPEQRSSERWDYSQPLRICPVLGGIELADPIDCVAKDISAGGIGFFLPEALSAPQVYINLPDVPQLAGVAGLAQVVRKQPRDDGWFEIGAVFNRPQK